MQSLGENFHELKTDCCACGVGYAVALPHPHQPSMLLRLLSVLLMLLLSTTVYSQRISGRVTDEDGEELPGAYVRLASGKAHVHCDDRGVFQFPAASVGDTLVASYIGYTPLPMVISSATAELNFRLLPGGVDLSAVTVRSRQAGISVLPSLDIAIRPVQNSQELLRRVPGLFIGQHAGGGKAEQLFLRGFDIDHGTDVAISVDGLPVNMVSHAHGQGYADLHFVIPESVDRLAFAKGPYAADQGNFATAGYVSFKTKDRLTSNSVSLEGGQFGYGRLVTGLNLLNEERRSAYLLTEFVRADGPFDSPQHFRRFNGLAKYTATCAGGGRLALSGSHFTSEWDASGQIPERAVRSGSIGRFGAIDDTEGGTTSRTNVVVDYTKSLSRTTFIKATAGYSHYDFELFSNFTFFLEDPEFGDQIRQRENRQLLVNKLAISHQTNLLGLTTELKGGIGLRMDWTEGSELSNTIQRRTVQDFVQLGDINEVNLSGFAEARMEAGRFTLVPALRYDHFTFEYLDQLAPQFVRLADAAGTLSPKLSLYYDYSDRTQLYAKAGLGFHANDSRVILAGNVASQALPTATGIDLGSLFKPSDRLYVEAALWYLALQQEFVYVGDAGVVEPSGRSRRFGVDLSLRYQLGPYMYTDLDATHSIARSVDEAEGQDRIPLAPTTTLTGGVSLDHPRWKASLRARYLADRPANEDYSITATGYTVFDGNLTRSWSAIDLGLVIENLLDTEWNEAQFATESRLAREVTSVEEIHFTPGAPFSARAKIIWRF